MNLRFVLLLPIFALGCDGSLAIHLPEPAPAVARGSNDRFEPKRTGTVGGSVKWVGDVPAIEPVMVIGFRVGEPTVIDTYPNPNAPRISKSGELQSALVYLKGVDPRRAKPMVAATVGVELEQANLAIVREGRRRRTDWAPLGSEIRIANRLDAIGGIRARGASFFTQMLPKRDDVAVRNLTQPGRTTFTSASGQYWAVADLFVSEHPYIANVNESGRFQFDQVPDGEYELVAWHPNWRVAGHELDPETGVKARQSYKPPVEIRCGIRVTAGAALDVELAFTAAEFKP